MAAASQISLLQPHKPTIVDVVFVQYLHSEKCSALQCKLESWSSALATKQLFGCDFCVRSYHRGCGSDPETAIFPRDCPAGKADYFVCQVCAGNYRAKKIAERSDAQKRPKFSIQKPMKSTAAKVKVPANASTDDRTSTHPSDEVSRALKPSTSSSAAAVSSDGAGKPPQLIAQESLAKSEMQKTRGEENEDRRRRKKRSAQLEKRKDGKRCFNIQVLKTMIGSHGSKKVSLSFNICYMPPRV